MAVHDEQTKAALLEGQSVSAVAREYRIPKGTVSSWKARMNRGGRRGSRPKKGTRP